jgi:hypothetical protein
VGKAHDRGFIARPWPVGRPARFLLGVCECPLLGAKRTLRGHASMSASDAVDGARSGVSKCYTSYVGSDRNKGGEATANVEAGALKELARARRRNADRVDPGIGRTRLGHRTLKCAFTIGPRSAQSIMASGFTAAQTGRTHDRTRPMLQRCQKVAKAPSTVELAGSVAATWPLARCAQQAAMAW